MILDLHLGQDADFTLTFEFYNNSVTKKFYERMLTQNNDVISRTQFYNLGETQEDVKRHLENIIDRIKLVAPNLLESSNIDDLNLLHINFPKYQQDATGELLDLLREFNYKIHHLENKKTNSNAPAFLFACEDPGVNLVDSAYDMFTVSKKFGELYMPYPHVGKHLFELFLDHDVNIPQDQIVCTNKMCNGGYVWLGPEKYTGPNHTKIMRQIFSFYRLVQHKMPYGWGDSRLAIGYLPLAKMSTSLSHEQIIHNVSKHQFLHSWTLR
jgi:hypothetical protein